MTPDDKKLVEIVKQANPRLSESIDDLPDEKKAEIIRAVASVQATQQGRMVAASASLSISPVPHPEFLVGYNQAIPDGASRLFTLIEEQSHHRIDIEKAVLFTQNKATLRGQIFAFILTAILVVVATWFAISGDTITAGIIFGTTILGVSSNFIFGKNWQARNLSRKDPRN